MPKTFTTLGLLMSMFLSGLVCSGLGLLWFAYSTRDHRAAAWHNDMGGIAIIAGVILDFIVGGFIGNYAGAILYLKSRKPRAAGWMCMAAGGMVASLTVLVWTSPDDGDPRMKSLDIATTIGRDNVIFFAVALVVVAAMVYFGFRLIKRAAKDNEA